MFILKIPKDIIETIAKKLLNSLQLKVDEKIYFKTKYGLIIKRSVLIRLELLLALIRYRKKDDIFLHPMEKLTQNYIRVVNNLIQSIKINNIKFITRIQLDIEKPKIYSEVPDLLYALRVYLTADNGAANSIKVLGVSDD